MNIQDLSVLLAAIELAVKRGAFSFLEIGTVGQVAEKLNGFLLEAKKQSEEATAAAAAEGQPAEEASAPEATA